MVDSGTTNALPDLAKPIQGDQEAIDLATKHYGSGDPIHPYYAWVEVTPELAKHLLINVRSQARITRGKIEQYAADMEAGNWQINGEPILIGDNGDLLEGRARLRACLHSGVPFKSLILWNVDSEAFETINTQLTRTLNDALKIREDGSEDTLGSVLKIYRSLGTVLRILWRIRHGQWDYGRMGTDVELLSMLDQNPLIRQALVDSNMRGRVARLPLAAAMRFFLSRIDKDLTSEFFNALYLDGVAMATQSDRRDSADSPIRQLNDTFKEFKQHHVPMKTPQAVALFILAWNAYATKERVKVFAWKDGEQFPQPAGWSADCDLVPRFTSLARSIQLQRSKALSTQRLMLRMNRSTTIWMMETDPPVQHSSLLGQPLKIETWSRQLR